MSFCVALLFISAAAAATVPGEFHLSADGADLRLTLIRHDTLVDAKRVLRVSAGELLGFDPTARVTHRFRLVREAGVFEFTGSAASGRFTFTPDAAFEARIRTAVRNWWDPGVAFEAAASGLLPIPDVRVPPLPPLPAVAVGAKERLRVHGVTPDLLRQMKQAGFDTFSTNDLIQLRSRGINANDISDFQSRGYRNLSVDEMVKIKNDGFRTVAPH